MTSTERLKELFNIYESNKISITPLRNIKIGNNHKSVFKNSLKEYWGDVKNNKRTDFNDIIDDVNNGICGFAIRTGFFNNIIVIDYDLKETSKPDFINRLHNTSTLTIKTASGGFHFIYKYTSLLETRTGIFGNIDIINNNKPIFNGLREDGEYTLYSNNTIKEVPEDIIISLNENVKQLTKQQILTNTNDINKNNNDIIDDINYFYNITDDDLLILLNELPKTYVNKWNEWLSISFILKKYGYKEVWDKWSKSSTSYNHDENMKIWDMLELSKDGKNLNYIIFILNHYIHKDIKERINNNELGLTQYKIFSSIQKVYGKYHPLSIKNKNKATKLNTQYINHTLYLQNGDIIIQSGTNTGKSYSVRKYFKYIQNLYPNIRILTISHLISLCEATIAGFNKDDINITEYKSHSVFKSKDDYKEQETRDNLAYVVNSIDKIASYDFSNYIIYLDEIHALLKVLLTSTTLNNKRKQILRVFNIILKKCHKIIATDGCICDNVLTYIKKLKRLTPITFYINEYKAFQDKPAYIINDYEEIFNLMKNDIQNERYFILCCNTRKDIDELKQKLKPYIPEDKLKIYTSKDGEKIGDVNIEWDKYYIMFSPSIIEGVDDNNPKNVYVIVNGNTTINPEQVSQQIARNRNPINTYLYINTTDADKILFKSVEDIKHYYRTNENALIGCYADLVDTRSSIYDGIEIIDNDYSLMFYNIDYHNHLMMSSFKYYLLDILKNKGYIIHSNLKHTYNIDYKKECYKNVSSNIKEEADFNFDEYINNNKGVEKYITDLEQKCEMLGINTYKDKSVLDEKDKELLLKYKKILTSPKKWDIHLNIRTIIKKNDYLDRDFKEYSKKDFKYKMMDNRVFYIKTFKSLLFKYFPSINPLDFKYDEKDFIKVDLTIDNNEWINLKKSIETTKKQPNNNIDLLRMLFNLAGRIYGDDIIKYERRVEKDHNRKSIQYNKVSFNTDIIDKHITLFKTYINKNPDYIHKIDDYIINQYINI